MPVRFGPGRFSVVGGRVVSSAGEGKKNAAEKGAGKKRTGREREKGNNNNNNNNNNKTTKQNKNEGEGEAINGIMRKKVFWSLGKRRATIATKQIDIDTKDFLLLSTDQATEWNVNLLEKRLKAWMKTSKYSTILNQIADELPVYGSVILRKTKDGAELADLRYTFLEQSAPSLKKSRYLIFKHLMTPEAMREMEGTWDNVREAME